MADNVTANPGSGGPQFATNEIGGVHWPRMKVTFGTAGVATDVHTGNPLPVGIIGTVPVSGTLAVNVGLTDAQLRASAVPVSLASTTISGSVAVTGTFWQATQPVSAAALPLPAGASTSALQTTGNTSLGNIDGKLPALSGGRIPVVLPAGGSGLTDSELRATPVPVTSSAGSVAFAPFYDAMNQGGGNLGIDPSGALAVRATGLTDEGTFRVNFANAGLGVALGTVTLTNGSRAVAWTIGATTDLHAGDYIKLDADAESAWAQVNTVDSLSAGTLVGNYSGTGGTSAGSRALVQPFTGSGGTAVSVTSGQAAFGLGTTVAAATGMRRLVDFPPLVFRGRLQLSQRIANQDIYAGMREDAATPRWYARFQFNGTTNTTVICQTGRNPTGAPAAAEQQTTTVTLPNGLTTATMVEYRVEVITERVLFFIDSVLVAQHTRVIPSQHDEMAAAIYGVNGGSSPGSNTTVTVDYLTAKNHNKLEVGILSDAEQIVVQQPDLVPFSYTQAGVIAINTVLLSVDCLRYRALSIQSVGVGTTGVVTPEWSSDGSTWLAATIITAAGATATTFNAAGLWQTPVFARYFRLRLSTATTAGTTTILMAAYSAGPALLPTQPVSGTVTANAGTGTLAVSLAANTPTLAAGANLAGDFAMQYRASATGAATPVNVSCPETPAVQTIKAAAGRVLSLCLANTNAAARFLKVWNTASGSITLGTTAALFEVAIPANGLLEVSLEGGWGFGTAINIAITGGQGLTNNTAVTAGDVTGFIGFA